MKTILIVDDHPDIVFTIELLLKKNNYNVLTALSAEECVKKLKTNKPNLILIDGLAAREKILDAAAKVRGLRIAYLITDEAEKENFKLYSNVAGFINEPSDIKKFLEKIKELLK